MASKSLDALQALVGWTGPAFEVPITADRIRDFAGATEASDPVFRETVEARADGYPDVPAPPTFLGSLFFLDPAEHRPDLGFDSRRTLHGEQAFEYERPPVGGETLYGRVELTDVTERDRSDGGTLTAAELTTTFRDADGDLVVRATSTLLEVN